MPSSVDEIAVEHGFGDQLQLEWAGTEGEYWELIATFQPRGPVKSTDIDMSLTISFSCSNLPPLELPIYVLVTE